MVAWVPDIHAPSNGAWMFETSMWACMEILLHDSVPKNGLLSSCGSNLSPSDPHLSTALSKRLSDNTKSNHVARELQQSNAGLGH